MNLLKYLLLVPMYFGLAACATVSSSSREASVGDYIITVAMPNDRPARLPSDADKSYELSSNWAAAFATKRMVRLLRSDYHFRIVDGWPLTSIGEYCVVVADVADVGALSRDDRIASVQPIHRFVAMRTESTPVEPPIAHRNDLTRMQRLHEWATGKGVSIGIIDTPVDSKHPALKDRLRSDEVFLTGDISASDFVHGTAVAGIIGGASDRQVGTAGFAPEVALYGYGACRYEAVQQHTLCNTFSLAKAIETASADHLNIVNLSLAGPYDALLGRLLDAMIDRGTIVVASDNPASETLRFPAMMKRVIGVTTPTDRRSLNPEPIRVDDESLTTVPGGGYQYFYGSSMSAARVSGLIALLLQHTPGLDEERVREQLGEVVQHCDGRPPVAICAMRFALTTREPAVSLERQAGR